MRETLELLRGERAARRFFLAHAQSALGTGAGYVALLVIAYDRFRSPWAITLVLLADFLPAMLLGPVFGAAADRWSRRACAIAADVARAVAFIAIAFVGSIEATVALALLAGAGAGLFTPAVLAGLPSLVAPERLPAATSLYGALNDLGKMVGPGIAALLLLGAGAELLAFVNGATFLVSALILATVSFGAAPAGGAPGSLLREAREGLVATARMPGIRALILSSSGVLLFAGMMNVAELLLAHDLGAGEAGFSALVAAWGAGVVLGSLDGARKRTLADSKRRYLAGLLLWSVALLTLSVVPVLALAFAAFALVGYGNGLTLVNERILMQATVSDALMARVFAAADTLGSWAFAIAFLSAGAVVAAIGTRELFVIAGVGGMLVWVAASIALRGRWESERETPPPVAEPVLTRQIP